MIKKENLMNRTIRTLGVLCILTVGSLGTTACGNGGTGPFPAIELPGNSRYGMSSWIHEGRQYVIIQLNDGLAAMALPR